MHTHKGAWFLINSTKRRAARGLREQRPSLVLQKAQRALTVPRAFMGVHYHCFLCPPRKDRFSAQNGHPSSASALGLGPAALLKAEPKSHSLQEASLTSPDAECPFASLICYFALSLALPARCSITSTSGTSDRVPHGDTRPARSRAGLSSGEGTEVLLQGQRSRPATRHVLPSQGTFLNVGV